MKLSLLGILATSLDMAWGCYALKGVGELEYF
jgi:hypothetical protein